MRAAAFAEAPKPAPIRVERDWEGQTCIIAGSGPSLRESAAQIGPFTEGLAAIIAIKEAYRLLPWADICYGADFPDWKRVNGAPDFHGRKIAVSATAAAAFPGVEWMEHGLRDPGLSTDPGKLYCGFPGTPHSGFQAINLAVLLGARRILLIGYDMKPTAEGVNHFFPNAERKNQAAPLNFDTMLKAYDQLPAQLATLGVEVINCTPGSAIEVFPRMDLAEALA